MYMEEVLEITERRDGTFVFRMKEIEVDGIPGKRDAGLWDNLFFSLKEELDSRDEPADTGYQWHFRPDLEMSERHWLKCGNVIPKHALCPECGERDLDEHAESGSVLQAVA